MLESRYCTAGGRLSPPVARANGDPPALNLAELGVGHVNEQGQAGNPDAHLQLSAQEAVGEVEHHSTLSSRLLPVDVDIVTSR